MALSRGQFTNVISKGKKMGYKNPTGPQKFDKKVDGLSEKRKLQMGIIKKEREKRTIDKDSAFLKKNIFMKLKKKNKIKKKKSKKKL